ncbi:hypothetical protein [Streptomyces sp. NPDC002078]
MDSKNAGTRAAPGEAGAAFVTQESGGAWTQEGRHVARIDAGTAARARGRGKRPYARIGTR